MHPFALGPLLAGYAGMLLLGARVHRVRARRVGGDRQPGRQRAAHLRRARPVVVPRLERGRAQRAPRAGGGRRCRCSIASTASRRAPSTAATSRTSSPSSLLFLFLALRAVGARIWRGVVVRRARPLRGADPGRRLDPGEPARPRRPPPAARRSQSRSQPHAVAAHATGPRRSCARRCARRRSPRTRTQAIRQQIADLLHLYGDAQPLSHHADARPRPESRRGGAAGREQLQRRGPRVGRAARAGRSGDGGEPHRRTARRRGTLDHRGVRGARPRRAQRPRHRGACRLGRGRGGAREPTASTSARCRARRASRRTPGSSFSPARRASSQPAEVDALDAYVRGGGRLLVLVDTDAPRSVLGLLDRFGVEVGKDVVVDQDAKLFGADGLSARVAYLNRSSCPIAPAASALLPLAQSHPARGAARHGRRVSRASPTRRRGPTWADARRRGARLPRRDRSASGRCRWARWCACRPDGREGRLVAIGDSDFASNFQLGVLGNRDLLLVAAEVAARGDQAMTAPRRPPTNVGSRSPRWR